MSTEEKISKGLPILDKTNHVKMRNLIAQIFMNLIHGFGLGTFNVVFTPFLKDFTGSLFYTGVIISFSSIMQFIPMPLIGKLSDRFGIKKVWLFGPPLYALGLIILFFSSTIPILILGVIVYILGMITNSMNFQLFVAENSGDSKKGIMYGLVFFAFFGGSIGGASFVMLNPNFTSQFYFLFFTIILIVEWLILALIIRTPISKSDTQPLELQTLEKDDKIKRPKLFQNPKIKVATIFFALDVFVWGISLSIFNAGLSSYYNFTDSEIASVVVWFHVSNMVTQIPAGRIADKIGKKKCLIISQYFGMVFFSMNILVSILWSNGITVFLFPGLIIGQIFYAIAVTTFIPSEQMTLTNLGNNRKAESYGIVLFFRSVGLMPTGAIAGFLAENVHYMAPFVVSFVGLFVEIWFLRRYFKD
ncbi:MAG: MFS transporter [Candidatus Lokiarchaeota archaeon]|nr:MFS transporter [Candidatus Lokiarchaeota archaeon]